MRGVTARNVKSVRPGEILSDWFGATGGAVIKLERSTGKAITPEQLRKIRRDALEEVAEGRGVTPEGMAALLESFRLELAQLVREQPESEWASWWLLELESLESPLGKPPGRE